MISKIDRSLMTPIKKEKRYKQAILGFPGGTRGKEPACQCRRCKRHGFDPWVGKIPWRRAWQPTPVFLPGESHGQRSLVGYSPQGGKSQTQLKQITMHVQTNNIRNGKGNISIDTMDIIKRYYEQFYANKF